MQAQIESFLALSYRGVPGVLRIDSAKPGPTSAILAATHGNETGEISALM